MEKIKFYHVVLLDESGSMKSIRDDTISGFNETIQQIKSDSERDKENEDHYVCLTTFNGNIEYPLWLQKAKDLYEIGTDTYSPGGMTSLRDAICNTINHIKNDLHDELANNSKQLYIMFTIVTDGMDTSSQDFSPQDLKEMIDNLDADSDDSPWTLIFIGANQDSITTSAEYGINSPTTQNFSADSAGVKGMFAANNAARSTYTKAASKGLSKSDCEALYATSSQTGKAVSDEEIDYLVQEQNATNADHDKSENE